MVSRPKTKCCLTIKDNFTGIKVTFALDPIQKWNTVINDRDHFYQLNKGRSGTLNIPKSLFDNYFYIESETH